MSETNDPLPDGPAQQAAVDRRIAARERREAKRGADAADNEAEAPASSDDRGIGGTGEAPAPEKTIEELAEEAKARRAELGITAAPNGDPAAVAFGARIEQARFEHRNQGHDATMDLLDEMLAGLQRLEAKLAADAGG